MKKAFKTAALFTAFALLSPCAYAQSVYLSDAVTGETKAEYTDWKTDNSAVYSEIGNSLYTAAAPKDVQYWDFEDESEIGETIADIRTTGVWTDGIEAGNSRYVASQVKTEDALNYNKAYREQREKEGKDVSASSYNPYGIVKDGAKNSEHCLEINNVSPLYWRRHITARVKLDKENFVVGKSYNVSFWAMGNQDQKGMWVDMIPYRMYSLYEGYNASLYDDLLPYNNDAPWVGGLAGCEAREDDFKLERYWQKFTKTFTVTEDTFNSDGFATLWIVVQKSKSATTQCAPCEKLYIDDVSIEPCSDIEENNFIFTCDVSADAQSTVNVKATVDGKRTLFETVSSADGNGKTSLTAEFALNSNDAFLLGDERGSADIKDNGRVKIEFSGADGAKIENARLIKKINPELLRDTQSAKLSSLIKIYAEENGSLKFNFNTFGGGVSEYTANVKKGENSVIADFDFAPGAENHLALNIFDANGNTANGREYYLDRLYTNGAPMPYSEENLIKKLGAGKYILEFKANGDFKTGDTAKISYMGQSASVELSEGDNVYMVDFDIANTNGKAEITNDKNLTLTDITLKKVS